MDRRIYIELFSILLYGITYFTSLYFVCFKYSKSIIPIKLRNKTTIKTFYLGMTIVSFGLPFLNALIWKISNAFESRSSWYELSNGLMLSFVFWFCLAIILSIIFFFGVFMPIVINFDKTIHVIKAFFIHMVYTLLMIFIYTIFLELFDIQQAPID